MGMMDGATTRLRQLWRIESLDRRVESLEYQVGRLTKIMAKDKEALARLDEQIAALRDYVRSDEETDASEVDRRTEEIKGLLVEAQGSGAVPPEQVAKREREVAAVNDEAAQQTGR